MGIRKPHNLVTLYWDDCEYFFQRCQLLQPRNIEEHIYLSPVEKREIRYCILSSVLFLEAFINAEYFSYKGYTDPRTLSNVEKDNLKKEIFKPSLTYKWSNWLEEFLQEPRHDLRQTEQFRNILKIINWRNQLTHYKIHDLMLVATEVETIESAKQSYQIVRESIGWFYDVTKNEIPDWIRRDILLIQ